MKGPSTLNALATMLSLGLLMPVDQQAKKRVIILQDIISLLITPKSASIRVLPGGRGKKNTHKRLLPATLNINESAYMTSLELIRKKQ